MVEWKIVLSSAHGARKERFIGKLVIDVIRAALGAHWVVAYNHGRVCCFQAHRAVAQLPCRRISDASVGVVCVLFGENVESRFPAVVPFALRVVIRYNGDFDFLKVGCIILIFH